MTRRKQGFADKIDSLSYGSLFSLWFLCVLVFATIYWLLSNVPGNGPVAANSLTPIYNLLDILYFSIITATSTGYGDIVPIGLSRLFASVESVMGIVLFGVVVSKLLTRRQDIALSEVHELSFQTAFHNMREDLYTARKDLDQGIAAVSANRTLLHEELDRMAVAFQQIGHLLHEIPSFYDYENELYTIDARREKLLIEAVERTFLRVLEFLEAVRVHSGAPLDGSAKDSLREMVAEAEKSLPRWKRHSSRDDAQDLRDVQDMLVKIKKEAR